MWVLLKEGGEDSFEEDSEEEYDEQLEEEDELIAVQALRTRLLRTPLQVPCLQVASSQ